MLPRTYNSLETNEVHQKVVRRIWWILRNLPTELSESAHKKAAKYLCFCIPLGENNPPQKELTAGMKEIDKLMKKVVERLQ